MTETLFNRDGKTKRRMGSPESRDGKIRGGRPGVRGLKAKPRGLKGRERPVQTNEEVKRKMRHQNYLDRISSPTAGYMTGGQAKIAAKAPPRNKIDGKDFAVLRAEKAKGRGQGLQDEKLKPGKVTKAGIGAMILGKKKSSVKAPMAMGAQAGAGAGLGSMGLIMRLLGKSKKDGVMKADKGKMIKNDPAKTVNPFAKVPMKKASTLPSKISKAAKANRYGKIALGVAGVALAAKAGLEKMYEKRTGKKPFTKRPAKKMGGGMMQRPMMGYKSGTMVKARGCKLGRSKPTKLY
jgi:hypothetical protein